MDEADCEIKPLSDNTLGEALRTADIPATVNGMRAGLRDRLAADGVAYELAEAVIASASAVPRGAPDMRYAQPARRGCVASKPTDQGL